VRGKEFNKIDNESDCHEPESFPTKVLTLYPKHIQLPSVKNSRWQTCKYTKTTVFWVVTVCIPVDIYLLLEEPAVFIFRGEKTEMLVNSNRRHGVISQKTVIF
jgi:hypothetical protein